MEKYKTHYVQYQLTGQQKHKDLYEQAEREMTKVEHFTEPVKTLYSFTSPPPGYTISWYRLGVLGIVALIVTVL